MATGSSAPAIYECVATCDIVSGETWFYVNLTGLNNEMMCEPRCNYGYTAIGSVKVSGSDVEIRQCNKQECPNREQGFKYRVYENDI